MKRTSSKIFRLVVVVAIAFGAVACKKSDSHQGGGTEGAIDDDAIRSLVDQLASRNPDAGDLWGQWFCLPANYDWDEHRRVCSVESRLYKLGLRAVPALLERLDDPRYSTARLGAAIVGCSVGAMCQSIITDLVLCNTCLDCEKGADWSARYFGVVAVGSPRGMLDLRTWWAQNKRRSLREMRIAAAEFGASQEGCAHVAMKAELKALRAGVPISLEQEDERREDGLGERRMCHGAAERP